MSVTLIAAVVALVLGHLAPSLAVSVRRYGWYRDWIGWLKQQDDRMVAATGKRAPGGKGDKVIEDAPGRYVKTA